MKTIDSLFNSLSTHWLVTAGRPETKKKIMWKHPPKKGHPSRHKQIRRNVLSQS